MNLFGLLGRRFRKRGREFLLNGDWELAAAEYRKSIARNPDCVESLQGLGVALLKQHRWAEGEAVLEQVATKFPDLPGSLYAQLGMARIQLSRWPEALDALTQAVEIDPTNTEYHGFRGTALLKLERWQEAVSALNQAIVPNLADPETGTPAPRLAAKNAEYLCLQGTALLKLERWQDALVAFDNAIESRSRLQRASDQSNDDERVDAEFQGFRGTALLKLERWQDAVVAFSMAIEGCPSDASYFEAQAQAFFELGRYEETVTAAQHCIELKPDVASTHVRLGAALVKLGRESEALSPLKRAVQLDPSATDIQQMLARTYAQLGQTELAIQSYRRVIELDPDAKSQVALPLAELGFVDEQDVADLTASVDSEPDNYDLVVRLALVLAIQQKWDAAVAMAHRGLKIKPDGRECHKVLGQANLARQDDKSAADCFRTALKDFSEYNFAGNVDELSLIRECYEGLSAALRNLNRDSELMDVYRRQLNVTFDPQRCLEIGRRFQQEKQEDLATRAFVRAIVMDHHHLDSYKVLGDHLEQTGRPEEALAVYQEVNAMGRVDDELRSRLAKSMEQATRLD